MEQAYPSSWIYWPTEKEPNNKYKYAGLEFSMKLDKSIWTRQNYGLLDWLGDLGGLLEVLLRIGSFLVEPIASFTI